MQRGTFRGITPTPLVPAWMGGGDPDNDGAVLLGDTTREGNAKLLQPLSLTQVQAIVKPSAALFDTGPRFLFNSNATTPVTGVPLCVGIALPAGVPVKNITFMSGSTAAGSPTHQWFALLDSNLNQLATTVDNLTTAWAATTARTLAIAAVAGGAASVYVTPYTGLYYLALVMSASTMISVTAHSAGGGTTISANTLTPVISGSSNLSAPTSPPAFPQSYGTLTAFGSTPYAYVS